MTPTIRAILVAMAVIVVLSVLIIVFVFLHKQQALRRQERLRLTSEALMRRYYLEDRTAIRRSTALLFEAYRAVKDQIELPVEAAERAFHDFSARGAIRRWMRMLHSPFPLQRKVAASRLALFPVTETKSALVSRLRVERRSHVRLYLIDALKNSLDQLTITVIIASVAGSKRFYQLRVAKLITNYILPSRCRIPDIFTSANPEIKELFVDVATAVRRADFVEALRRELAEVDRQLAGTATPAYAKMTRARLERLHRRILVALATYGADLAIDRYLHSPDPEIVRIAVGTIATHPSHEAIQRLFRLADGRIPPDVIAAALHTVFDAEPRLLQDAEAFVRDERDPERQKVLAHILAAKIEYFLLRFQEKDPTLIAATVKILARNGFDAPLIRFLNLNRDPKHEEPVLRAMASECQNDPAFLQSVREYLDPALLRKIDLKPAKAPAREKQHSQPDPAKARWLVMILTVGILFYPLLFALRLLFGPADPDAPWLGIRYLVFVNNASVLYFLAANLVYILLGAISIVGAYRQRRLWSIKNRDMLYEDGMLASITIIAPAYNEEVPIVESVSSLLNLRYPDYEVVVVNDGSEDHTLEVLIEHFHLERRNVAMTELLATRPVRAVYANPQIPNLMVIDKDNGGKADALNVGINFAHKEYVCGIDADSLLEPDALLKLMSSTLDHDKIPLALGGNIIPANGCVVDRGQIVRTGLSHKWLPLAQTVEYLRAFTLGRIGWAELDGLLIVSGAFGLFERRILAEVGGYLTVATFRKDTVGEDMELVARIARAGYERKLPFRIDYIHNANCYTEVPERLKSLRKQRGRWQRGLIDVLAYHRRMTFNPRYGTVGMVSIPYFLFFETIGPMLEVQTYLALILSFVFGILSVEIALLMFLVSVVLGIFVSMTALLVAEKHTVFLPAKDTWRLVGMAVAENFGRRQFWSLQRLVGLATSFSRNQNWGAMTRVGFKK